jgi:hypothetical protein
MSRNNSPTVTIRVPPLILASIKETLADYIEPTTGCNLTMTQFLGAAMVRELQLIREEMQQNASAAKRQKTRSKKTK